MAQRRSIVLICSLALTLRLVPVLLTHDLPIVLDDMFQYDALARSIVAGHGYRWYAEEDLALTRRYITTEKLTGFRAPGYPAFLALVYAVGGTGGHRFFAARLAQAFLGAALVPLCWVLARQIGFREPVARWTAIIISGFPLPIVYPLALASESLFGPLLTLALVLVLKTGARGQARDPVC